MKSPLDYFFYPESIAVIGATKDPGKAGYQIFKNLLDLKFQGPVYPVNPRLDSIFGHKCYPGLEAIEDQVELIIVTVPAFAVADVFKQAARRGDVKAAVIIASGFSETKDPERIKLEKEVLDIAKSAGIRVIGPNCVGVMNTHSHLDTTFAAGIKQIPGHMSIISQSGSLGASIMMFSGDQPVPGGFSKWAHVGNQCDIDVLDVINYYCSDDDTKVIAMYMEGIDNAREFLDAARKISREKTIIALKVGRSEMGSGAAASHTGSLAGSDKLYDAAFCQAGVIRVNTIEELLDTAKAISTQPLPKGNRIAVLTEAGGPGIIAVDEIGMYPGAVLAKFLPETKEKLRKILPPMAIIDHLDGYVDMSAAANEEQHAEALRCVLNDPGVDAVVHLSVPPSFLKPDVLGKVSAEAIKEFDKPVMVCYLAGDWVKEGRLAMENAGIPTYDMPERAARAMVNMVKRANYLKGLESETPEINLNLDAKSAEGIIKTSKEESKNLTEIEARKVLESFGIEFGEAELAKTKEEVAAAAEKIGYPAVLKIVSPEIIHKSDAGGVKVNLKDRAEVEKAFDEIISSAKNACPDANIHGVLVTSQAESGTEMIIGATRDPQYGPCVMAGFGGIFVEVLKDVSFRVAPVTRKEAYDMLRELKLYPVLEGVRGQTALSIDSVADAIIKVAEAMVQLPEIKEIDINPIRVYKDKAIALDARIII